MYFLHLGSKAKFLQGSTLTLTSIVSKASTRPFKATAINRRHSIIYRQSSINVISTLNGIKQSLLCRQFKNYAIDGK